LLFYRLSLPLSKIHQPTVLIIFISIHYLQRNNSDVIFLLDPQPHWHHW